MFYFTTSKGFLTTAWHVSAKQEAMICYKCTFTLLLIIALLCRVVLLNSYESQKQAAHGKEAVIADARPLNLLTVSALVMKLTLFEVAYILVLIESIGKRTKSMDVPAIPPAKTDVKKVFTVNCEVTT